jgi:hypothetical protein
MGAVQDEIERMAVSGSGMNDLLSEFDETRLPRKYSQDLIKQHQSLTITVPKRSWQSAGHDLDDPGQLDMFWFEESEWLLVNLSTETNESE